MIRILRDSALDLHKTNLSEFVLSPTLEAITPHLKDLNDCTLISLYHIDVATNPANALVLLTYDVIITLNSILSLLVWVKN